MTGHQKALLLSNETFLKNKKSLVWSEKVLGHPATLYFGGHVGLITRGLRDVSWILNDIAIPLEALMLFSQLDGQIVHRKGPRGISSVAQACITLLDQTSRINGDVKFRVFDAMPKADVNMSYEARISNLKRLFRHHPNIEVAVAYEIGNVSETLVEFQSNVANNVQITGPDTHSIILRGRQDVYGQGSMYKIRMAKSIRFRQARVQAVRVVTRNANNSPLTLSVDLVDKGEVRTQSLTRTMFNVDLIKVLSLPNDYAKHFLVCVREDTNEISNIATGWM
jgi:hypothetical protein